MPKEDKNYFDFIIQLSMLSSNKQSIIEIAVK